MHAPAPHPQPDTSAAPLRRVTLHLARGAGFPDGSDLRGYEMTVPLRADGHLEPRPGEGYSVRRFWAGEPDRIGVLKHRAGGVGGATWVIDYDETTEADDEAGYRFDFHVFVPGEYVTVADRHGTHTFRVASVSDPRIHR